MHSPQKEFDCQRDGSYSHQDMYDSQTGAIVTCVTVPGRDVTLTSCMEVAQRLKSGPSWTVRRKDRRRSHSIERRALTVDTLRIRCHYCAQRCLAAGSCADLSDEEARALRVRCLALQCLVMLPSARKIRCQTGNVHHHVIRVLIRSSGGRSPAMAAVGCMRSCRCDCCAGVIALCRSGGDRSVHCLAERP